MAFKEVNIKDLNENFVKLISEEWALICAGDPKGHNMMTASWGFFGEMWNKHCAMVAIRPQRYTLQFVEQADTFALCFLGEDKAPHKICGSKSGRDIDKTAATGLTPIFADGTVYFAQARLVFICKKLYTGQMSPTRFLDEKLLDHYPTEDYHKMFIGEVVKVLKAE